MDTITDTTVADTGLSTTPKPLINGGRNETLALAEVIVSAVIIGFALFGNSVVIFALWRKRKSLSRMHFFIFHLCIADLISAFLSQFPQMLEDIYFHFHGPNILCKIIKFFALFPMYLSTFILLLTAIDRYLAICHPLLGFRGSQTFRMRLMVISAWCLAALFASPQLILWDVTYRTGWQSRQCWFQVSSIPGVRAYITIFGLVVLIIPAIVMTIIYGLICFTVWTRMGNASGEAKTPKFSRARNASWDEDDLDNTSGDGFQMKTSKNGTKAVDGNKAVDRKQGPLYRSHTAASRVSRAKVKTVKMTLTIVSVYIACWSPFFAMQLNSVWGTPLSIKPAWLQPILMKLANLNTCANPWIYLSFSGNMAHELASFCQCFLVCGFKKWGHRPQPKQTGAHGEENSTTSRYLSFPTGVRTTSVCTGHEVKDHHKIDTNANTHA